jgi:hypothetical protein
MNFREFVFFQDVSAEGQEADFEAEVLVAVVLAVGFGIRTCSLGKRLPIRNKFLREGSVGGKPS